MGGDRRSRTALKCHLGGIERRHAAEFDSIRSAAWPWAVVVNDRRWARSHEAVGPNVVGVVLEIGSAPPDRHGVLVEAREHDFVRAAAVEIGHDRTAVLAKPIAVGQFIRHERPVGLLLQPVDGS